ncbi:MAG: response regulator [Desulfotignum sp.]|nr:response regulator [Desulfotignum sp.]
METILLVDDEESIRRLLGEILSSHGYRCIHASNGKEARRRIQEHAVDLALCDVNMPGESGIDLARHINKHHPDTAVLMVTGEDSPEIARAAIESGTYGYIIKPFHNSELVINVQNALRRQKLEIANRMYRQNLEKMVTERTASLKNALEGMIQVMARTIETKDPYTAGHQQRVADLAVAMAEKMNLSSDQVEGIHMAGRVHDLGKISVPAEILSKPGKLTDIEFALIKTHAMTGYNIIADIEFPWPIARMVLEHHEKMNGTGYPRGLSGDEILPESRILCVADVVEAMSSHRPYRPALGIETALDEISRNKGVLYDTDAVDACLSLFKDGEFRFD